MKLLVYSLPLIPLTAATSIMYFTDRIFIKYLEDLSSLGIYGLGARFATIITVIIGGFSMAIAPLVFQKHLDEQTNVELKKIFNLFIAIGTTGLLILSFFAKETVILLSNERYIDAYTVMPYLYLSAIFIGLNMFSHGLYIKKKTGLMSLITVIFAGMNVALNFLLIPDYGIQGAAIATVISTAGLHITLFLTSQRYFPIEIEYKKILLVVFICIGCLLFFNYYQFENYVLSFVARIVTIILFVILIIKTKVFQFERFRAIFMKKFFKK